ncbi:hypothetical protein F3N42_15055 [Marinihelvus fidelis]|uniref:Uncharacterized protein n=1 Tax=Marinihelvus fidelis TaxID=2613842 RepID=A0A5N0T3N3_9GAMM|nr:hypothetical protein [Marinihelvus fidelis]KAA9129680.1 hypothetical protein F3N42_15055 [Marinihelvus fidelis]
MEAKYVLAQLTESTPEPLSELSNDFGLYALWDHEGQIRYIGCTPKATEGFRTRITNKHVTGSEGRSHKFSQAYCCGRMWRYCRKLHPEIAGAHQSELDAKLAKKLRTIFIRTYCKATYVQVPNDPTSANYFESLTNLESEVQQLASPGMRAWEGIRFTSLEEPTALVDELLTKFPELKESTERQGLLYDRYVIAHA